MIRQSEVLLSSRRQTAKYGVLTGIVTLALVLAVANLIAAANAAGGHVGVNPDGEARVYHVGGAAQSPEVLSWDGGVVLTVVGAPDANFHEEFYSLPGGHRFGAASPLWGRIFSSDTGLSPDGRIAVAGSSHGDLMVFNVRKCKRPVWRRHIADTVSATAISPNGRLLGVSTFREGHVWGSVTGRVAAYDLASGARIHDFGTIPDPAEILAFSPDSRLLAAGGRAIRVFDIASRRRPASFGNSGADLVSLGFGMGRYHLYVARRGTGLTWWDAPETGRSLRRGRQAREITLAWSSPDGRYIAEFSEKRGLMVFRDGDAGEPIRVLHPARVERVQFLSGDRVALLGPDVQIFGLPHSLPPSGATWYRGS